LATRKQLSKSRGFEALNLLTKTEFAAYAGKSAAAVSKAIRNGRLETFQDTGKINPNSAKSQKFAATIGQGQKNIIPAATNGSIVEPEDNEGLKDAGKKVLLAQEKKIIEEAGLKEQQRIEKEMKNAVRRGELVEIEAIEKMIALYLDRWLNTNKRRFNANFDQLKRNLLDESKTDHEVKRELNNLFESWSHEAKTKTVEFLRTIQIEQGRK
jgi:hypothetical protein